MVYYEEYHAVFFRQTYVHTLSNILMKKVIGVSRRLSEVPAVLSYVIIVDLVKSINYYFFFFDGTRS